MTSHEQDESFRGFPAEAFTFFEQLARHNDRDWFQGHKEVYERACREPMKQLVADLGGGPDNSKISRINRDLRFARDKKPYRTYIGAGVHGSYISISSAGVFVGGGLYRPEGPALERYRVAVDDDVSGRALQRIITTLRQKRYLVAAHETLKGAPRGFAPDHPRVELLRMKGIYGGRMFPPAGWLSTPAALGRIRRVVTDVRPLVDWIRTHVGARDA